MDSCFVTSLLNHNACKFCIWFISWLTGSLYWKFFSKMGYGCYVSLILFSCLRISACHCYMQTINCLALTFWKVIFFFLESCKNYPSFSDTDNLQHIWDQLHSFPLLEACFYTLKSWRILYSWVCYFNQHTSPCGLIYQLFSETWCALSICRSSSSFKGFCFSLLCLKRTFRVLLKHHFRDTNYPYVG